MYCTFCKTARVANEAPCPNCGAPSPLLNNAQNAAWGAGNPGAASWGGPGASGATSWGGPETPGGMPSGGQWEQPQVPQMSFNNASAPSWQTGSNTWQQPSEPLNPMPSWQQPSGQLGSQQSWQQPSGQLGAQSVEQSPSQQNQQQSMLPVPYQGGMELQPEGRQPTISLQLVPQQAVEHLLPAEPINPEVVHVPPTFTKPRPIVPRRRVISGFLSVLIVALLLCSGAGYYAKASGTWDKVVNLYTGGSNIQNVNPNDTKIPDPPQLTAKDSGPAMNVISSVSLAVNIDKQNNLPIQPTNVFTPGQTFYLTFSVQPPKGQDGTVTTKWYTNNIFYRSIPLKRKFTYNATNVYNTDMTMQFQSRLSGYVELYWNNQFAQRRYFAVR